MRIIKDTTKRDTGKVKHIEWSYAEFVDFAENRKPSKRAKSGEHKSSREKRMQDWYGTKNFDEAMELAIQGWDSGLEQLKLEDGTLAEAGIEINANVTGSYVNIGNFLQGLPDNMWELNNITDYSLEELIIVVRLGYTGGYGLEEAMVFCQRIADIVNKYQAKYAVKLVGRFENKGLRNSTRSIIDVVIKETDERFVLNNVAFSFHPSFWRRLCFSHLESEDFITSGYGCNVKGDIKHEDFASSSSSKLVVLPHMDETRSGDFEDSQIKTYNL